MHIMQYRTRLYPRRDLQRCFHSLRVDLFNYSNKGPTHKQKKYGSTHILAYMPPTIEYIHLRSSSFVVKVVKIAHTAPCQEWVENIAGFPIVGNKHSHNSEMKVKLKFCWTTFVHSAYSLPEMDPQPFFQLTTS